MTEIKGYEDYILYENGKIYSKKRFKFLKPSPDSNGYLVVGLCKNGEQKNHTIHRLLGIHFIPNPNNYPVIDHIDRKKTNNNLINLRWCSYSTNGKNTGLKKSNKLKQKYIIEHEKKTNGKYYYYYVFKITGIIQKSFSCNKFDLDDVVKIRDKFCLKNNINLEI